MESHQAQPRPKALRAERALRRACLAINAASPALYIAACWALLLAPQLMQRALPRPSFFLQGLRASDASRPFLLPATKHAAWQLGHTHAMLTSGALDQHTALQQAAAALGVDAAHLLNADGAGAGLASVLARMQGALAAEARPSSALASFLSFQTLLRLLWLAGIAGICCTLGPAAYYIFRPLLLSLYLRLRRVLRVVAPIAARLGRVLQPLGRPVGLYGCLYVVAAGSRYPAASAPYVAFTGHALALVLYWASLDGKLGAHGDPVQRRMEQWAAVCYGRFRPGVAAAVLIGAFAVLAAAPTAVQHGSQLLAFWAVLMHFSSAVAVCKCLMKRQRRLLEFRQDASSVPADSTAVGSTAAGSTAAESTSGVGVRSNQGWFAKEDSTTWALAGASLSVLLAWAVLHKVLAPLQGKGALKQALQAYEPAVAVLGRGTLLFAGLMRCSEGDHWRKANTMFVLLLVGSVGLGWATGQPAVHNTAVVFLVLWAAAKVGEVAEHVRGEGRWVLWLGFSLALWRISLFLSTHPAWLASLFGL